MNFVECCTKHDHAYTIGGNETHRRIADVLFRKCIRSKAPNNLVAPLWIIISWVYYFGVRIGKYAGFRKSFKYHN